ncbi:Unknown protein, partial [Striga hermonthica]
VPDPFKPEHRALGDKHGALGERKSNVERTGMRDTSAGGEDAHEMVMQAKGAITCAHAGRRMTRVVSLILIGIGKVRILNPAGLGKATECRNAHERLVTRVILEGSGNIFLVGIGKVDAGSKHDPSRNRNGARMGRDLNPRGKRIGGCRRRDPSPRRTRARCARAVDDQGGGWVVRSLLLGVQGKTYAWSARQGFKIP